MRVVILISSVLALVFPGVSPAQIVEYANQEYRFSINFPAEPIQHSITYTIADGQIVPAALFAAETRRGQFSVIAIELPEDAAHRTEQMEYVSDSMRNRNVEVAYEELSENDGMPIQLFTLVEPSGRRSMIGILVHNRRLYITEGNAPKGAPPPVQFQQTLFILDEDGEKLGLDDSNDFEEYKRLNPR